MARNDFGEDADEEEAEETFGIDREEYESRIRDPVREQVAEGSDSQVRDPACDTSSDRADSDESGSGHRPLAEEEAEADEFGFPRVSLLEHRLARVDVTEVFSPPRVTVQAKKFGLKSGEAWDLTNGWDFNLEAHRKQAERYIDEQQPLVVIGSPPCTPFSQLQALNSATVKSQRKWQETKG